MSHGEKPWWSFLLKRPMHYVLDAAVLLAILAVAYLLRFEFDVPRVWLSRATSQAPVVVGLQILALQICGVYSFIWRYVGLREVKSFLFAAVLWTAPLALLRLAPGKVLDWIGLPWSILVMDTTFGFIGVLGMRVIRRSLYERFEKAPLQSRAHRKPVLLIGAGRAGALAAREILGRGDAQLEPKGFVDDDPEKVGSVVHGIKVVGTTAELPRLVRELGIDHVVITIAKASRNEFRRILDLCEAIPIKARVIPGLAEILEGSVSVTRIRDVQVEDLLGREPVQLDRDLMQTFLTGRVVLVTGAGGSIGSELCRQIARFGPSRLLLVERAEGALFDIDRELRRSFPDVSLFPLICDVTDETRLEQIFVEHRPEVILHAAAHKHVPMMEANPGEAVKNNVVGTRTVADLAGRHGAQAFVLISTDKAVRPSSVMGASKRVAELVIQDLDRKYDGTRFVAVRFGNVLGSAGSVIPIFREQIQKGGPVTVTHPEMVRYFMTIPEAAQLVLQAGAMGEGGEIFVLDMGEPVKIVDLARDMIRLSGLKPGDDVEIVFSGIRPGEKLFEELATTGEEVSKTRHPKIFIGRISGANGELLAASVRDLVLAATNADRDAVRNGLRALIPEAVLPPSASLAPAPAPTLPPARVDVIH